MTRTRPPTPKGQATRAHLIDVASRLFADRGYTATSFSELIGESGLTKGAFYFYFRSKADLARAVIAEQDPRWVTQVRERVVQQPTPARQLTEIPAAMVDLLSEDPGAWSIVPLMRELGDDPDAGGEAAKPLDSWLELVAGTIRAGQSDGSFRNDVDPDVLAVVLVGSFDGIKSLVDTTAGDDRLERLRGYASTLASVTLAGLRPPTRQENPT